MIAPPPAAIAPAAANVAGPVRAVIEPSGDGLRIRLIAQSGRATSLRYVLHSRAGGNEATQSGSVRLEPGVAHTLLDLTQAGRGDWAGMLEVVTADGDRFLAALSPPR